MAAEPRHVSPLSIVFFLSSKSQTSLLGAKMASSLQLPTSAFELSTRICRRRRTIRRPQSNLQNGGENRPHRRRYNSSVWLPRNHKNVKIGISIVWFNFGLVLFWVFGLGVMKTRMWYWWRDTAMVLLRGSYLDSFFFLFLSFFFFIHLLFVMFNSWALSFQLWFLEQVCCGWWLAITNFSWGT